LYRRSAHDPENTAMTRLAGRTALITGAAGGIGSAAAALFCAQGARVALVDLDPGALADVVARIRRQTAGAELLEMAVDLAEPAAAPRVVAQVLQAWGTLDVLVNNAGIRAYEPLAQASDATWERVVNVNLLAYARLAREALPALRASGRGAIVNISSTHAAHPRAGMGQYDATKAAIVSLSNTLAYEEAVHGVRVNTVCPGLTLTPFHVRRFAPEGKSEADLRAERVDANLLRRWADPFEVAWPIVWLASDEASFVTASTLMVDGGTRG
jgi:2-hydroxycyclohexanecarboxyl-CoA dehydrogenase